MIIRGAVLTSATLLGLAWLLWARPTPGCWVPARRCRRSTIMAPSPVPRALSPTASAPAIRRHWRWRLTSRTMCLQTDIHVGDTQIILTNQASGAPFCFANTPGTACVDQINGFDFKFTGENILGVSADRASAAAFLPVTGTFQGNTHLGLQLLSPNEIWIDVTGDLPLLNDQLILDLAFTPPPPPAAPEPGTLALLGSALAGMVVVRRQRKR